MPDDLTYADIAGHIVIDIEAAREADRDRADVAPPAPPRTPPAPAPAADRPKEAVQAE